MNMQQNDDGTWGEAKPLPYYEDQRPLWLKIVEFPLRLLGVVTYCPLKPVPKEEPTYTGHVPCKKCGATHWMYGCCEVDDDRCPNPRCDDGAVDTGGVTPWGAPIFDMCRCCDGTGKSKQGDK
jgi:hypothetical protein